MKKNRIIYILINILFLLLALFFSSYVGIFNGGILGEDFRGGEVWETFGLAQIVLILVLFVTMHMVRFMRMYFVLLEDLIRPSRFLQIYLKTTFVSTLIPFKIGEIFKMYCYGYETNSWMKGVIAVLIEKFFDAIVLCSFMVPFVIMREKMDMLLLILIGFIVVVLVLYFAFPGTYKYLNRFLICRAGGKKSLGILKMLEAVKITHDIARRMVKGRFVILLSLSFLTWLLEAVLVGLMATGMFDFGIVFSYVSDAFFGVNNVYFNYYVSLCAVVFFVGLLVIYGQKYFKFLMIKK